MSVDQLIEAKQPAGPGIAKSDWIDVQERLPELHDSPDGLLTSDLVLVLDSGEPCVAILYMRRSAPEGPRWVFVGPYDELEEVTHWWPIPESLFPRLTALAN